MYEQKGIEGRFHAGESIARTLNETLIAMGFELEDVDDPIEYLLYFSEEGGTRLYYSIQDMEELIPMIPPIQFDFFGHLQTPDYT
jgi:hypothetical protein